MKNIDVVKPSPGGRESGFELLRIVAMSCIVMHHFILHAHLFDLVGMPDLRAFESVALIGVNLFLFISGYFMIRLSWRSLLQFVGMVVFFLVITVAINMCTGVDYNAHHLMFMICGPVSASPWWFIQFYFVLMMFSPLLNGSLKAMSDRQLLVTTAIVLFVNLYSCGTIWNMANRNGYSLTNFLTCYVVGAALCRFRERVNQISLSKLLTCLIAVTAVNMALWAGYYDTIHVNRLAGYSFPLLYAETVLVFMLFMRVRIGSVAWINRLAACAFGVYMLQDGIKCVYPWQRSLSYEPMLILAIFAGIFFAYWIASAALTWVYRTAFGPFITRAGAALQRRFALPF